IYIELNHSLNRSIKLPLYIAQSNQTGELVAAKMIANIAPPELELDIETDSKYVITVLNNSRKKNEDEGYITTAGKELVQSTVASFRQRRAMTCFGWVKGHAGHERNEEVDKLAKIGLTQHRAHYINLTVPPSLCSTGAKLNTITQSLAYQAIISHKGTDGKMRRTRTKRNITQVKEKPLDLYDQ
ncbi:hypothetical protein K435DRAFT_682707, partial [Dendrothele bispora CBS 962.96]